MRADAFPQKFAGAEGMPGFLHLVDQEGQHHQGGEYG